MRWLVLILTLFLLPSLGRATHNRAGEISYIQLDQLTYLITITTYTLPQSVQADRCELEIYYGDNQSDTIPRVNGNPTNGCPAGGELLSDSIRMNVYQAVHTYPGSGSYILRMLDPNRKDNIKNVPNSVDVPFYIESELIVSPFVGANNSPILLNPPIDDACVYQKFEHNPGAVDLDGDSLAYSLVPCKQDQGVVIGGYQYPNEVFLDNSSDERDLYIEPYFGTLVWDAPQVQGEYNVCIQIDEYRRGVRVGRILRDMQVTAYKCNNNPPEIIPMDEICVLAGETVEQQVGAFDIDNGTTVTLTATGLPLILDEDPATFGTYVGNDVVSGTFVWETSCDMVRNAPYYVNFKAKDDRFYRSGGSEPDLVDYDVLSIKIVAPPPINLEATPLGNTITVDWEQDGCPGISGYTVYRRIGSTEIEDDSCYTGIDPSSGYKEVGTVSSPDITSFTDEKGLLHGQLYCYKVVANFPDGAESMASVEVCAELKKDLPVITHASVGVTSSTNGVDTVRWSMPTELDTLVQYPGPYNYEVLYNNGNGFQPVFTQSPNNSLSQLDTVYIQSNIDTESKSGTFKINLYHDGSLIGASQPASTPWIIATPSDERITLDWSNNVPWSNHTYVVYRQNKSTNEFEVLDTVEVNQFVDSVGLANGKTYRYVVETIGDYLADGFISPLINWSQELSAVPIDNVPPCPPNPTLESDCEDLTMLLTWEPSKASCSKDLELYRVYFKAFDDSITPFVLMDEVAGSAALLLDLTNPHTVAGCYQVTAVDTVGNESEAKTVVCADNCPLYSLPNVFSPGQDGWNDLFYPVENRSIERINLTIYNRWGEVVYQTNEPEIMWNGRQYQTGEIVPPGVYYYVCEVFELRLSGLEERTLKGYLHLFGERSASPSGTTD